MLVSHNHLKSVFRCWFRLIHFGKPEPVLQSCHRQPANISYTRVLDSTMYSRIAIITTTNRIAIITTTNRIAITTTTNRIAIITINRIE